MAAAITWAPWDMPDGTFQRVYDALSSDDLRALRAVSRQGKALVNAHARRVDLAPAGGCTAAIRKKDAKALLNAGPMYQLARLECRYGSFGLLSARRLVKGPAPRLVALDLRHTTIDARVVATLAGSTLRLTLEDLRLSACRLESEEMAELGAVSWPALRRLDVAHNMFALSDAAGDAARLGVIADALVAATPSLDDLDVSFAGEFAVACLARLAGWPGLEQLRAEGLHAPSKLVCGGGGGLKVLSLRGSRVDSDLVDFIAGNSATLENLSLSNCKVRGWCKDVRGRGCARACARRG